MDIPMEKLQRVPKLFDLTDKVGVVTGGNKGLGRGMALALAAAGANVAVVARSKPELDAVAGEIKSLGRDGIGVSTDVTDPEAVGAMVESVMSHFHRIDILINAAGMIIMKPTLEMPVKEWEQVIKLNLEGTFLTCQAVGRVMVEQQKGKIINISSVRGHQARANDPAYPASKAAVNLLTKSLAIEWAPYNITVNAIAPTFIKTDLNAFLLEDPKVRSWVVGRIPMGRVGNVDDLFGAAIFLAAEASDFITGQVLYVDGGWTAA